MVENRATLERKTREKEQPFVYKPTIYWQESH